MHFPSLDGRSVEKGTGANRPYNDAGWTVSLTACWGLRLFGIDPHHRDARFIKHAFTDFDLLTPPGHK